MWKGWDGICSLAAEWAPLHSLCCFSGSQSLRDALKDLWFVERLTFGLLKDLPPPQVWRIRSQNNHSTLW